MRNDLVEVFDFGFAIVVLDCLLGGEGEDFACVDDAWDTDAFVDHSFGYERVATPLVEGVFAMRLGCGTHGGAHVALVFVGHLRAIDTIDDCGSTDL